MIVHKSLVKDDDEKASVQTTETVLLSNATEVKC